MMNWRNKSIEIIVKIMKNLQNDFEPLIQPL